MVTGILAQGSLIPASIGGTMKRVARLATLVVLSIVLLLAVAGASAAIKATVDADERVDSPVPHRYIHGVIPGDAKFQLALPDRELSRSV